MSMNRSRADLRMRPNMRQIAIAELRLLFRNRLVAASALLVPVMFATVLIVTRDTFPGGAGSVVGLAVIGLAGLGVYVTATTTLATRRQTLFLKRLRSTTVSDGAILAGLLVPVLAVNIFQVAVVLVVMGVVGVPAADTLLVIVGVIAAEALFLALALLTSVFSRSAEHAQVTTLPLFFVSVGVAGWIAVTGTEDFTALKRLLPGGAAVELMMNGWFGTSDWAHTAPALVSAIVWPIVVFIFARTYFRWDPRR